MDFKKFAEDMKAAKAAKMVEERAAKERATVIATVKSTKPATVAPATKSPATKKRQSRTDDTAEQNWRTNTPSSDASGFSRGVRVTVEGEAFVPGLPDQSRKSLTEALAKLTSERGMISTSESRIAEIDATIYAIQAELAETV